MENISEILEKVYEAVKETGKDPVLMIAAYITQGDERYITRSREARSIITSIQRKSILEQLLNEYLMDHHLSDEDGSIAAKLTSLAQKTGRSGYDPVLHLSSWLISGQISYITKMENARDDASEINYIEAVHEIVRHHFAH